MYDKFALIFKVLSDPNRIKILDLLIKGDTCGCTLINKLPISQSTLSYHLKMISESGLANSKREGTSIKYYVNRDKLTELMKFISLIRDNELK